MDPILLLSGLVYGGIIKLSDTMKLTPATCSKLLASFYIFSYMIVDTITMAILGWLSWQSLFLLVLQSTAIFVSQVFIGTFIFRIIQEAEGSFGKWILSIIIGAIILLILLPAIIKTLVPS